MLSLAFLCCRIAHSFRNALWITREKEMHSREWRRQEIHESNESDLVLTFKKGADALKGRFADKF